MSSIDPIAAMNAAVISVGNGEADEIEMEWRTESIDGNETVLSITVRRHVRHIHIDGSDNA